MNCQHVKCNVNVLDTNGRERCKRLAEATSVACALNYSANWCWVGLTRRQAMAGGTGTLSDRAARRI